jgi:transposase
VGGKMLKLRDDIKIYLSLAPIDARKSIDGLCVLISNQFDDNPQCGSLFVFFNKSRDKVKIIWWDANGFVLHYKRLEKRRFVLPRLNEMSRLEITQIQLHGLLAGLDFTLMRHFPEINYHQYS